MKLKKEQFVPKALVGKKLPEWYPESTDVIPKYEDNSNGVLYVCICGEHDQFPPLETIAKDFRIMLHYKNSKGEIVPFNPDKCSN